MITHARSTYMDASVATADPARLLVMLCDRLVLDVQRALTAQQAQQHQDAHPLFVHAQAIVLELRGSLRPEVFDGGDQLAAIYDHLHQQLVHANIHHDELAAQHCLSLVTQLAETWRQAAMQLAQTA